MWDWLRGKQKAEENENKALFRQAFIEGLAIKFVNESFGNGRRRR